MIYLLLKSVLRFHKVYRNKPAFRRKKVKIFLAQKNKGNRRGFPFSLSKKVYFTAKTDKSFFV